MATYSGGFDNSGYTLYLDVSESNVSTANNTSVVNWTLRIVSTKSLSYGSWDYDGTPYSVSIDGSVVASGSKTYDFRSYQNLTVASGSKTITHNSDGSRSVYCNASFGNSSTPIGDASAGGTLTLTTIPRASTVSCSSPYVGDVATITINRKSSSFTHHVTYHILDNTLTGTIADRTSETVLSFDTSSLKEQIYALIPNAKSIGATIRCRTYSGNTKIGDTQVASFKLYANEEDCKPTVSLTATDTNTITRELTGDENKFIKYFSNATTKLTATVKNSASVKSISVTCGDGKSSVKSTDTFNYVESASFTGSVTDSRGYSNSVTLNKTLINYIKLTCNVDIYRPEPTTGEIHLKVNGNYFNNTFGSVANTITLRYRYKESTSSTWSNWTTITATKSGNKYSYNNSLGTSFDYTKSYNFEINVYDKLMNITDGKTVTQGIPVFDWGENDFNFNVPVSANNVKCKNLLYTPYTENNKLTLTATKDDYAIVTGYYCFLEAGKIYTFSCKTDGTWGGAGGTDTVEIFLLRNRAYDSYVQITNNPKKFTPPTTGTYFLRCDVNQNGKTHSFWDFQIEEGEFVTDYVEAKSLDNKQKYSTDEIVIGTWIDGKPLYRKTFRLANIGTQKSLGLDNLETLIIDAGNSYITWNEPNITYPIDRAKFEIWIPTSEIKAGEEGVKDWQATITVKYTKTTD